MKRISVLFLMLCMVGCDLIPSVVDESIPLPAPVVIDSVDKVPSKPVPSPMPVPTPQPKQEATPAEVAQEPVKEPVKEVVKRDGLSTGGSTGTVERNSYTRPIQPKVKSTIIGVETRWAHNGHWSYPGSTTDDTNRTKLRKHLLGAPHYVVTDGMAAEQVLNLHDALHEGTTLPSVRATVSKQPTQPTANVAVSTLTQYTIASCGYCKTDQRDVLPQWAAKGWVIKIVDETANPRGSYPRYELRGADGSFRTHSGSLRNWK